ncbi:DNA starvation/stationary phase protection protein [Brevibacillus reuszeri]|uniref:DNA starvation/stationary phase protection protein n=1 Tax=Brevibacillus reuszeri TaxID=54915 RepID=A0A0K9YUG5_9BACL|nr:Dps family protein [Brevibacillus reuszeri]KNB72339.1 general stress protein [Brevibacillus reuszeri]MED1861010.1 DNA starvation/stationary phase protection protein [Brevibacillus reuszeri]GED70476.1 DNA starvation/stationary phase protection protein [Brevibacillus reuszeri]
MKTAAETKTIQEIQDMLNKQVSNWSVLYVKLHNFHWYVKGSQFFTLHTKFQEFYEAAALYIDDLAERVLVLGGKPEATMKRYLEISSIKEASGNESAEQMIDALIEDFNIVIEELKVGMKMAGRANDETTADMLLAIHSTVEKNVWMLKAFNNR